MGVIAISRQVAALGDEIAAEVAEKLGYNNINGLDMLVYQAVAAQEIWFGQTPDFNTMKIAALENL